MIDGARDRGRHTDSATVGPLGLMHTHRAARGPCVKGTDRLWGGVVEGSASEALTAGCSL